MTDEVPVSGQRQGPAVPSGRVQCAEVGARVPAPPADPREVEALCSELDRRAEEAKDAAADLWADGSDDDAYELDAKHYESCATALRALVAERDELRAEVDQIRRALTLICDREWIIASWYDDTTRNFNWRVNVLDGRPPKGGRQSYKGTTWVGATAVEAALAGIAAIDAAKGGA